jgi:hypothetical protein
MSSKLLHRGLSGHIADLGVEPGVQGKTNHGRQDKSAAFGPADVVGRVGLFAHLGNATCRRFTPNSQRFQYPERQRSCFSRKAPG